MTKRSKDSGILTAVIVPNNEQAVAIADQYSLECDSEKVCLNHKGIEIYLVKSAVFAHIPGYNHTAVSTLYEGLRSFGGLYRHLFLITTAVSCTCVKEGVNELISIETVYSLNPDCSKDFGFYLPEGAQKIYPAIAVSQCDQNLPKTPLPTVQVLLNLNVMVDALTLPPRFASTSQLSVMAVNVDKIACKYEHATVRKLLFENKDVHFQDFVRVVVNFVSRIAASEDSLTLPMTPPATCKKQRPDHLLLSAMDKEEYTTQKDLIERFERDFLLTTLSPDQLSNFTRCLGLTDNDYKNIEYEHNHKNPKEQIHCIVKEWFEKEGLEATVVKFSEALQDMNKKFYDNFLLYCKESQCADSDVDHED